MRTHEGAAVARIGTGVSTWLSILLGALAVAALLILLSNVVPRYIEARRRRERVRVFLENYEAFDNGHQSRRNWLAAHSQEMQDDAELIGQGVSFIAPPPAIGGGPFQRHQMFGDLFSRQTFAAATVTPAVRLDVLRAVEHGMQVLERRHRRDLFNPWAWLALSFERVLRFPEYVLRHMGFSDSAASSPVSRVLGAIAWLATVGSFVVGVIAVLSQD